MVRIPITLGTLLEEYFVLRNGEKCKMHNIDCCEGGLKLVDIATKNVGENDLNTRIEYIMVRLDNGWIRLVQEG